MIDIGLYDDVLISEFLFSLSNYSIHFKDFVIDTNILFKLEWIMKSPKLIKAKKESVELILNLITRANESQIQYLFDNEFVEILNLYFYSENPIVKFQMKILKAYDNLLTKYPEYSDILLTSIQDFNYE